MVEYVSQNDFYEIRLASLLSNVDKDLIIELYQPIVGAQSTILYLTLLKQKRNATEEEIYSVEALSKNTQMTLGQLLSARQFLEGVGLLKTFEKVDGNNRSYIYMLYAPKTPKDFFDDILFKGLLIQAVGEKEALALASKYEIDMKIPEGYKEISASFTEMFTPDYNDPSFTKNINSTLIGHKTRKLRLEFNYDTFFEYIEANSQIRRTVFDSKTMVELERIANLYGADEKIVAFAVIDEYKPYESPHLIFEDVADNVKERSKIARPKKVLKNISKSDVSGKTTLIKKIQIMDETSPVEYLRKLQGYTEPSKADVDVVEHLSFQYNFSYGVINAIVDYTLAKCKNVLNFKFADKVAASVAREGLTNALDTMNYLTSNKTSRSVTPLKEEEPKEVIKENKESNVEQISDDEMDSILDNIAKKRGGKK